MSPAKTFNTPGLHCGFAVIPNRDLRRKFHRAARAGAGPNIFGFAACRAAYEEGEEWRWSCWTIFAATGIPGSVCRRAAADVLHAARRGHILAWLDTRWLGLRNTATFFETAGVKLSDGAEFQGRGYMRLNFGCPRATLQDALERIERAVANIGT